MATRPEIAPGFFTRFFRSEATGSVILLIATVIALVWANSPWGDLYDSISNTYISISWGDAALQLSLKHWINDGLMVLFFFVVGLEIKRELSVGHLSSIRSAILPVAAAVGGMIVPALIYFSLNTGGDAARGWGVPMATDIAFALGVLAVFGRRVPIGLKVFLTALAIADDMGAVLVIALFYTDSISILALVVAGLFMALIVVARTAGLRSASIYILLAVGVWLAVFASGVHATVAGILVAMLVPVRAKIDPSDFFVKVDRRLKELRAVGLTRESMLDDREQLDSLISLRHHAEDMLPPGPVLEEIFHPVQAFFVLPLFALFNAGVAISSGVFETLANPVSLGIVLGLFVGKQSGILFFAWLAVKSGYGALADGVRWPHIYGASCLAGIGFTMSLFVSELAFLDPLLIREAKYGILAASLLSGVFGFLVLWRTLPPEESPHYEEESSAMLEAVRTS